ncbi:MAG: DUF2891 domain-containing protein [Microcoleaceae cyanobacterium]
MTSSVLNPQDISLVRQFAQLSLDCIAREYPHVHRYWLEQSEDLVPPKQLTPVFYGCLDWHSAVHSHWTLIRALRCLSGSDQNFETTARTALNQNFTPEKIAVEVAHLESHPQFECPYGLAWFLQLTLELRLWKDFQAQEWLARLTPLETIALDHLQTWIEHLTHPDRTGGHTQTAFALGLIWDWTQVAQHSPIADQIHTFAGKFYLKDCNYPLQIEPLGYDFLSPGLAEADLISRLLSSEAFERWFTGFLPQLLTEEGKRWLQPLQIQEAEDYGQSHLDGLNLSRAWMLQRIASKLFASDLRTGTLRELISIHRQLGLKPTSIKDYSGSHWLGSFAVYLITQDMRN